MENLYTDKFIEQMDFYKHENIYKKDTNKFIEYLKESYVKKGINSVISILKSSGSAINFFGTKSHNKKFENILNSLEETISDGDKEILQEFKIQKKYWDMYINDFQESKSQFFGENPSSSPWTVNSYIIALELYLRELNGDYFNSSIKVVERDVLSDMHLKSYVFDQAIESTGLVLNYFIYQGFQFSNLKRNLSPDSILKSANHVAASIIWNEIKDLTEYWMYSDASIEIDDSGEVMIVTLNEKFELNNLISNHRFNSLRNDWQYTTIQNMSKKDIENLKKFQILENANKHLDILFLFLYLGTVDQEEKFNEIEIKYWLAAYKIIQHEAIMFLERNKSKRVTALNLDKVCLSLSRNQLISKMKPLGLTKEQQTKIIDGFIFKKENNSQDLVDCPLIQYGDNLILVPSLVAMSDAVQAITSNFMNKNEQLNFKGTYFEDRMKAFLDSKLIVNNSIYKKVGEEEYECDLAFIIEDELFLVECKAHSQPYTTRQHTKNLKVLYDETLQLNRIVDFYKENLNIVEEALGISFELNPDKLTRILLVTNMVGSPIYVNGVYIVDESSFTKMLNRNPPTLHYFNGEKNLIIHSSIFDIYKGELTAKKLKEYLVNPPQIEISKRKFAKTIEKGFNVSIERFREVNKDIHFDLDLSKSERELIEEYFGI
ncbi:hypothetical protein ACQKP0_14940 [Heyndrickxia sp. NPDC080065]|uniref:hypothetical protein n=1 Tax=Heyndrickxia sp. NPDC080065 TaxID=3390568 RepID=UPI003D053D6E